MVNRKTIEWVRIQSQRKWYYSNTPLTYLILILFQSKIYLTLFKFCLIPIKTNFETIRRGLSSTVSKFQVKNEDEH